MSWLSRQFWQHWHQYPRAPNPWRTGFRLWWQHDPPQHARDVRLTHSTQHIAMRGRNKSIGAVRMPRVRMPGTKRSARL